MKYLYVANWKMNMSYNQSVNFCTDKFDALIALSTSTAEIVLCPSFVALSPIVEILKMSPIAVGAQNCSAHEFGSYTGEVSAESLAQVGITHCIIGHSDRRIYHDETTEVVIKKVELLSAHNIQPIICIGETQEHFEKKQAFVTLTQQLEPIITTIPRNAHIIVAYEPVWSIGTGIIPEPEHLHNVFAWLAQLLRMQLPEYTFQLLYGGSVNAKNINQLKNVPEINGFLIGGASTDFEQLTGIITSIL